MRILQVIRSIPFGGDPVYVLRLCRGLIELGHEVAVLTEGGPFEPVFRERGIELIKPESLGPSHTASVAKRIESRGFEILCSHHYRSGRVAYRLHRRTGIPYIMTIHAYRALHGRMLVNYWSPWVIVVNRAVGRGLARPFGVPAQRILQSFLPVDPQDYYPEEVSAELRERYLPQPGTRLILHVSRFARRKFDVALALLAALPRVQQEHPETRLLFVGGGKKVEQLKRRVAAFAAEHGDVVRWEPPRPALRPLFNLANITVGTGLVAREALACGSPVVAAGRKGYFGPVRQKNFDAADHGNFGDLGECPTRNGSEPLASDLIRVLDDEQEWRSEADALSRRVAREFTPRRAAEQIAGFYERAL